MGTIRLFKIIIIKKELLITESSFFIHKIKKVRDVRARSIVRVNQPDIHKQLNRKPHRKYKSRRGNNQKHLLFSDFIELMKNDSYIRVRGALRSR
jgi:hypothetical protein